MLASEGHRGAARDQRRRCRDHRPEPRRRKESLAKAQYLQLYYDQFLPPAVGATVNDAVQGLFAGTASPEDVAEMIESSAAQELAS